MPGRTFFQHPEEQQSQHPRGQYLSQSDRQEQVRQGIRQSVGVVQDQRHYDRIGDDRRQGDQHVQHGGVPVPSGGIRTLCQHGKPPRSQRPQQGCQRAEEDVPHHGACHQVGEQASHKQSGNRRRQEKGQDAQCLGNPHLDCHGGQSRDGGNPRQCDIQCRHHGALCGEERRAPSAACFRTCMHRLLVHFSLP